MLPVANFSDTLRPESLQSLTTHHEMQNCPNGLQRVDLSHLIGCAHHHQEPIPQGVKNIGR